MTSGPPDLSDRILERGSDAHYSDPRYYSSAYRQRTDDVAYYCALAAEHGGPVLEYGCGNGRISLPLARAGLHVTGVDRSQPMLADLRDKLRAEPPAVRQRVRLHCRDMRALSLRRRFPLVLCTFNTLLHLYERRDFERFFARVRRHLAPRQGRFVFDTTMPDPDELRRDPGKSYGWPRFRHATSGEIVSYRERFQYDPLRQVLLVAMEFEPRDRPEARWITPLTHRQIFPQKMEALLHYNGLRLLELHGDFTRQAPGGNSTSLIYHCAARRR